MKNNLKELIDGNLSTIKEEVEKNIKNIDVKDITSELNSLFSQIMSEGKKICKTLIKKSNEYEIKIDYDRDTQLLKFSLNNNELTISVEGLKGNQTDKIVYQYAIPDNVDRINQNYNNSEKTMTFILNCKELNNEKENTVINKADDSKVSASANRPSNDDIKKMVDMRNNGASYRKIANEFGLSDKTVAKYIKKNIS